jgi:hypothetical protein
VACEVLLAALSAGIPQAFQSDASTSVGRTGQGFEIQAGQDIKRLAKSLSRSPLSAVPFSGSMSRLTSMSAFGRMR